ncbi:P-loop containing nucleoside triphosphate hydrolase protein [Aspergillus similis]
MDDPSPSKPGPGPEAPVETQNESLPSPPEPEKLKTPGENDDNDMETKTPLFGSYIALPLMNIVFGNIVGDFNAYFIPDSGVTNLYLIYLFIGKFVLTYVYMLCFRVISLKASSSLRMSYMSSLFSQPVSKLDSISVGSVTNTITSLSNTMQQSVSDRLAIFFQSIALLIAAYAVAFRYSWALTLVVSSAILFVVLSFSVTLPTMITGQRSVDLADEQHASIASEVFGSIRTVFSLGADGPLSRKYSEWVDEARRRGRRMAFVTGIHLALLFFSMYCSFALAFWFGIKLFREGNISNVGTVITVFFSVLLVVTTMGGIISPLMAISKAVSASAAFFSVIDAERLPSGGSKEPEVSSQSDIAFEKVTFAYPSRPSVSVLKGFSAVFQRGKTTAIVGPSGSGKSTIVTLLEQWYQLDPSNERETMAGEIRIDNRNINDLDLKWWRTQIGLVQQEPFVFNDTVYNNVAFGLIGSQWEDASEEVKRGLVERACKEAFVDEFVQRLPLKYSTLIGENGLTLSGGQRQRLTIARGIVSNPPILILDEATSSIDVRGERIVQAALNRVSKDRTTIMIAHRLSTVRNADRIIVLRDGENVEEGSHGELLKKEGVYSGLVKAQLLGTFYGADGLEDSEYNEWTASEEREEEEELDFVPEEAPMQTTGGFMSLGTIFYEQRAYWMLYIIILAAAAGSGSGFALQSYLFARLIEVFNFTGQRLIDAANFWALMFFVLALAVGTCYFILGSCSVIVSHFIATFYRKDYFTSLIRKPIPFFDSASNSSGTLTSSLSSSTKQLQDLFGVSGVFPLVSIFVILGCISISFTFGWKLAAVAVFAALPFIAFAASLRIRYETQFELMNAKVYAESSAFAAEAIKAFRTVSACTMEGFILEKYKGLLAEQREKALKKAWPACAVFAFSDSVDFCGMALTFWYGGQLLASREYDLVQFFVVYIAVIQGGQMAALMFSSGADFAQAKASAARIFLARTPLPTTSTQNSAITSPDPGAPSDASLEFRSVSFRYPSRKAPVFADLNLRIESGQFVAFVGPSGCGKSTLISLIERFYEPTQGNILFGGVPINILDIVSYRRNLSLVAQDPKLFNASIRENLCLGIGPDDHEQEHDRDLEERMVSACMSAEIHQFILSLPDGYNTALGTNASSSASLSGGQKQRICIARALLRNPRVLLLDEATSSLDSQSEKLVQQAMEKLAESRDLTIIAVAHRLATVQKADVIFVFGEDGTAGAGSRVLERGTHWELLEMRGVYWQMCQAQALDR